MDAALQSAHPMSSNLQNIMFLELIKQFSCVMIGMDGGNTVYAYSEDLAAVIFAKRQIFNSDLFFQNEE